MKIGLQKNGKIDYPSILTPVQKRLIGHEPNTLEFYNSPMVPSLSFMIDTQDAIKMFIGNNRKFKFDKKERDVFEFFILNYKNIYMLKGC